MAWIKTVFLNILLVIVSCLVVVVVVEVALHLTPLKLKYLYPLEPGGYLKWDPELGFDIVPSFATSTHAFTDLSYPVWSNRLGCYDYEYDGGSPYLYVTGDSFTWGFAPLADKWGKEVERRAGVRALTCGVNAYGTRQELIKTRRDLARLPTPPLALVVGYFEGNDLGDEFAFPNFTAYRGYRVPSPTHCDPATLRTISPLVATTTCNVAEPQYSWLQKIKFELSLRSVLYMMAQRAGIQDKVKDMLRSLQPERNEGGLLDTSWPSAEDNQELAWQIQETSIVAFKELAARYQTNLVFVLIPSREAVRGNATTTPDNERIKSLLQNHEVRYVELLPAFREREQLSKELLYWPINEHWNVAGNRYAGELVAKYLIENNLLSTSTTP